MLYLAFFLYFLVLFIIAILSRKKIQNEKDFWIAGGRLGLIVSTASLTATGIGGSAAIVAAAYIYQYGLPGIWLNLSASIFLILLGIFFAKKVRQTNCVSLPDLMGYFYGPRTKTISALLVVLAEIAWLSLIIQATQIVLVGLGWADTNHWILSAITIFFIGYTIWGGQIAVSYSDLWQSIFIFIVFSFAALPYLIWQTDFTALQIKMPADFLSFPTNAKMDAGKVWGLLFVIGLPHLVGPDIYAKIFSADSTRTASKAAVFAGLLRLLWAIVLTAVVLLALPFTENIQKPAMILPHIISQHFPALLAGFLLAAILAILMSSADTILLTASTVISHDILPMTPQKTSDQITTKTKVSHGSLFWARISIIVIGLSALGLALYFQSIIKTLELAYTIFAGGVSLPLLAGLLRVRLPQQGVIGAMIGGGASAVFFKLLPQYFILGIDPVFGGLGIALCILILSYFLQHKPSN